MGIAACPGGGPLASPALALPGSLCALGDASAAARCDHQGAPEAPEPQPGVGAWPRGPRGTGLPGSHGLLSWTRNRLSRLSSCRFGGHPAASPSSAAPTSPWGRASQSSPPVIIHGRVVPSAVWSGDTKTSGTRDPALSLCLRTVAPPCTCKQNLSVSAPSKRCPPWDGPDADQTSSFTHLIPANRCPHPSPASRPFPAENHTAGPHPGPARQRQDHCSAVSPFLLRERLLLELNVFSSFSSPYFLPVFQRVAGAGCADACHVPTVRRHGATLCSWHPAQP